MPGNRRTDARTETVWATGNYSDTTALIDRAAQQRCHLKLNYKVRMPIASNHLMFVGFACRILEKYFFRSRLPGAILLPACLCGFRDSVQRHQSVTSHIGGHHKVELTKWMHASRVIDNIHRAKDGRCRCLPGLDSTEAEASIRYIEVLK
eukprot:4638646-Pleurochrysis_carterae.AAC.6